MVKLYRKEKENINEAKQVGILYHVCTFDSFFKYIIPKNELRASGKFYNDLLKTYDAISFTRNSLFVVSTGTSLKADILFQIAVDGDKLSEKYKVTPYQDVKFTGNFSVSNESEEVVVGPITNFKSYIKEVKFDIKDWDLSKETTIKQYLFRLKKIKKYLGDIKCTRAYLPKQTIIGVNRLFYKKTKNTNYKINTLDDLINVLSDLDVNRMNLVDTPDLLLQNIENMSEEQIYSVLKEYPSFSSIIPLHDIICKNNISLLKFILEKSNGEVIKISEKSGHFPLYDACSNRCSEEVIKLLLKYGADVNNGYRGNTPISEACLNEDINVVKLLLEAGAEIRSKYSINEPLYVACNKNNYTLAKLLLEYGANPDQYFVDRDSKKRTVLYLCMRYTDQSRINIAKLLLEYGANPNLTEEKENDFLKKAVWKKDEDLVDLLIKNKIKINNKYHNALEASCFVDESLCKKLLDAGADPNIILYPDNIPIILNLVSLPNHIKVKQNFYKILLENGADKTLNKKDSENHTALYYACKKDNLPLVRLFIKYGADISMLGDDLSSITKNDKIIAFLEKNK